MFATQDAAETWLQENDPEASLSNMRCSLDRLKRPRRDSARRRSRQPGGRFSPGGREPPGSLESTLTGPHCSIESICTVSAHRREFD